VTKIHAGKIHEPGKRRIQSGGRKATGEGVDEGNQKMTEGKETISITKLIQGA